MLFVSTASTAITNSDATQDMPRVVRHAMDVASAPALHKLRELEMSAVILQGEQERHSRSRHCPQSSMDNLNERLVKLTEVIGARVQQTLEPQGVATSGGPVSRSHVVHKDAAKAKPCGELK